MNKVFRRFAQRTAYYTGRPVTFVVALLLILLWILGGLYLGFSTIWLLFVNTTTTIITFLMVFLIQNTEQRDTKAIQLKLDELIRSVSSARNIMMDLEHADDIELEKLEGEFKKLHDHYIANRRGKKSA